jgi:hypothetical protein
MIEVLPLERAQPMGGMMRAGAVNWATVLCSCLLLAHRSVCDGGVQHEAAARAALRYQFKFGRV